MENMILTLHVVVCVILILLVLLQSGKEGMGVIFGGGSQSLFGSTGAGGVLVKLTTFIAVIFIVTSLSYNIVTTERVAKESVIPDYSMDDPSVPTKSSAPEGSTSAPEGTGTPGSSAE